MINVVERTFTFEAAHRIWNQKLQPQYSCGAVEKCQRIHGHTYRVTFAAVAKRRELENGMVTDLTNFKKAEKFFDNLFDHRFLVDKADPILHNFLAEKDVVGITNLDLVQPILLDTKLPEGTLPILESLVICPGVPTAENISMWIWRTFYDRSNGILPEGVLVTTVSVRETDKTIAHFMDSSHDPD